MPSSRDVDGHTAKLRSISAGIGSLASCRGAPGTLELPAFTVEHPQCGGCRCAASRHRYAVSTATADGLFMGIVSRRLTGLCRSAGVQKPPDSGRQLPARGHQRRAARQQRRHHGPTPARAAQARCPAAVILLHCPSPPTARLPGDWGQAVAPAEVRSQVTDPPPCRWHRVPRRTARWQVQQTL